MLVRRLASMTSQNPSFISANLQTMRSRISAAQSRSAYKQEVRLVAVSKTKPSSDIMEAYEQGQRHFGENVRGSHTDFL